MGYESDVVKADNLVFANALADSGYDVKETIVLPANSLVLKTQMLRLVDIKEFDLICFINENAYFLRNSINEMSDWKMMKDHPYMKNWKDQSFDRNIWNDISVLRRKGTLMLYAEDEKLFKASNLHQMLEYLNNDSDYLEIDMKNKAV